MDKTKSREVLERGQTALAEDNELKIPEFL